MKHHLKFILLTIGIIGFLASCQCKTCKDATNPTVQICKGEATDQEYEDKINEAQAWGYTCE